MHDKAVKTKSYIPENIKFLMELFGLTQVEFGKVCEATGFVVSSWSRGTASPSVAKVVMICNHFDLNMDDFVNKELVVEKRIITKSA